MAKNITTTVSARAYEDHDDCLAAARREYAKEHGYDLWQVEADWTDDNREEITLTVSFQAAAMALTTAAASQLGISASADEQNLLTVVETALRDETDVTADRIVEIWREAEAEAVS